VVEIIYEGQEGYPFHDQQEDGPICHGSSPSPGII